MKRGKINIVKQPKYIIVEIITKKDEKNPKNNTTKLIPIKAISDRFKDKIATKRAKEINPKAKVKYKYFKRHQTFLTISKTYHSIQGGTYDSIILSLNPCNTKAMKIKDLSLTSLYVGLSRVHNFHEHKILPISKKDLQKLTELRHDPLLKAFFKSYDSNGNWISSKAKEYQRIEKTKAKLQLGLFDLKTMITKDFQSKIFNPLDINVEPKHIDNYKKCYKSAHSEGKKLLEKNNAIRLKLQNPYKRQLRKENMQTITKTKARYYARRLGIEIRKKNQYELTKELMKIRSEKTNIKINITDQDILNIINTDDMDTENNYSETDEDDDIYMNILNTNRNIIEINEDEDEDIDTHISNTNQNIIEINENEDEDIDMNICNIENSQPDDNVN
ncbi:MAG: hypothetical protein GY739_01740, partial [Mesoflavibacter sp.]|nr:hypothetical protein [Mesoflavibacter sp.]